MHIYQLPLDGILFYIQLWCHYLDKIGPLAYFLDQKML